VDPRYGEGALFLGHPLFRSLGSPVRGPCRRHLLSPGSTLIEVFEGSDVAMRIGWVLGLVLLGCGTMRGQSAETLPDAPMPVEEVRQQQIPFGNDNKSAAITELAGLDFGQQSSSAAPQTPTSPQQPPQPNPQKAGEPSLEDLGMSAKGDPEMQHRLDERTHDLKVHQRLGLFTLAPLAAACISSAAAPPDPKNGSGNTVGRDIHVSLGSLSVSMYALTAYYAIRAPRVGPEPAKGGIKWHKYLIYIHAPGMVLTPILGALAFQQAADGQKVHGIASAHAAVAWTTVASYGAAIVAVSWPIHLKL
jgi:hypothetical protein